MNWDSIAVPTLHSVVSRHARDRPGQIAIRLHTRTIDYAELNDLSDRVASAFRRDGVGAGERIVFIGRNSDAVRILCVGGNKAGVVPIPLN